MKHTLPARQRSLRDHNLGLALRLVSDAPEPLSRAGIAALSGLTRATASTLVDELLSAGLVQEEALAPTSRSGRPATGIALAAGGLGGIGLEINVDYLAATVVDLTGAVVHEQVVEADQRGRPPVGVLRSASRLAATTAKASRLRLAGLAVALPGLVTDGQLLLAPNLGWTDVDLRGPIRTFLPVTFDNEANFAALAEISPDLRSFVHVSGEIGIGGAIVVDGQLFRGTRGWSGEIGHVTVVADGPLCRCGARGCLEVYAGRDALASPEGLRRAGKALGTVLSGALNVLDVSTVVLGGTFAEHASTLLPAVQEQLAARVIWARLEAPDVVVARHGPAAAVLGAARSVVHTVLSEPQHWLVT